MGGYDMVADLFKTSPNDSPHRKADMLVVRGKAFMGLRQMARAKSSFRAARKLDPESVGALIGLGHAMLEEGNVDHAAQFLARVKRLAPNDLDVLLLEGGIAYNRGDGDRGEAVYREAVSQRPDLPVPRVGLAWALFANRRIDEAKSQLQTVIDTSPGNREANHLLATIAYTEGDYGAAVNHAQLSLRDRGNYLPSLLIAAAAKVADSETFAAKKALNHILALSPGNVMALKLMASAQLNEGDFAKALATLRPVAKEYPDDLETLRLMSSASLKQGDLLGAMISLMDAAEVAPNDPVIASQLGMTQIALKADDPKIGAFQDMFEANTGVPRDELVPVMQFLVTSRFDAAIQEARGIQARHPQATIGYVLEGLVIER